MSEKSNTVKRKRPSRGQRIHNRRVKQTERKEAALVIPKK